MHKNPKTPIKEQNLNKFKMETSRSKISKKENVDTSNRSQVSGKSAVSKISKSTVGSATTGATTSSKKKKKKELSKHL